MSFVVLSLLRYCVNSCTFHPLESDYVGVARLNLNPMWQTYNVYIITTMPSGHFVLVLIQFWVHANIVPPCSLCKRQCRDLTDKHASTANDGSLIQLTSHCRLYRCSNYMVDSRYFLPQVIVGRDPFKFQVWLWSVCGRSKVKLHNAVKLVWAKPVGIQPTNWSKQWIRLDVSSFLFIKIKRLLNTCSVRLVCLFVQIRNRMDVSILCGWTCFYVFLDPLCPCPAPSLYKIILQDWNFNGGNYLLHHILYKYEPRQSQPA